VSLYRTFAEIENDQLREKIQQEFALYSVGCLTSFDRSELEDLLVRQCLGEASTVKHPLRLSQ